ncbi:hypothetical protein HHK36_025005 [Tetracentron sinense]|uniref:Uncharacterized protein n=1 Tax=Tetracentron sinense TaxID=13715 RepID=A0A834YK17_TETSI|nr:hypothetical protein HHK36_025005 [Tetracentron sinense]
MIKMGGFPSKIAAATLAILLLLGGFLAIFALLPSGNEKGLWWFPDSRNGSRKVVPGIRGSFGRESQVIHGENMVSKYWRPLRKSNPPPPPAKNRSTALVAHAPPPKSIH